MGVQPQFLLKTLKNHREMFPEAVRLAVMGYHLEKTTRHTIAVEDFRKFLDHEMDTFKEEISQFSHAPDNRMSEIQNYSRQLFARVKKELRFNSRGFPIRSPQRTRRFSEVDVQGILGCRIQCF